MTTFLDFMKMLPVFLPVTCNLFTIHHFRHLLLISLLQTFNVCCQP